jgi:hypothetical protein
MQSSHKKSEAEPWATTTMTLLEMLPKVVGSPMILVDAAMVREDLRETQQFCDKIGERGAARGTDGWSWW